MSLSLSVSFERKIKVSHISTKRNKTKWNVSWTGGMGWQWNREMSAKWLEKRGRSGGLGRETNWYLLIDWQIDICNNNNNSCYCNCYLWHTSSVAQWYKRTIYWNYISNAWIWMKFMANHMPKHIFRGIGWLYSVSFLHFTMTVNIFLVFLDTEYDISIGSQSSLMK